MMFQIDWNKYVMVGDYEMKKVLSYMDGVLISERYEFNHTDSHKWYRIDEMIRNIKIEALIEIYRKPGDSDLVVVEVKYGVL